jgi:hypothetical protein
MAPHFLFEHEAETDWLSHGAAPRKPNKHLLDPMYTQTSSNGSNAVTRQCDWLPSVAFSPAAIILDEENCW